jgi:elongation factor 2 kinase
MDAKLWGEEFNRHNPPKKVDIFMMTVYEFHEREDKPLFHVEHFIDGDYIKYNSNSGFVDGKICRQTPQAFSHFTFERSGHELIVVDIQGVGDLYTDPQIHTAEGKSPRFLKIKQWGSAHRTSPVLFKWYIIAPSRASDYRTYTRTGLRT